MTDVEELAFIKEWGGSPSVHLEAHPDCCKNCPSNQSGDCDPFTEDFLALPFHLRSLTVFPCAWRPDKLCRGYAIQMGVIK